MRTLPESDRRYGGPVDLLRGIRTPGDVTVTSATGEVSVVPYDYVGGNGTNVVLSREQEAERWRRRMFGQRPQGEVVSN